MISVIANVYAPRLVRLYGNTILAILVSLNTWVPIVWIVDGNTLSVPSLLTLVKSFMLSNAALPIDVIGDNVWPW